MPPGYVRSLGASAKGARATSSATVKAWRRSSSPSGRSAAPSTSATSAPSADVLGDGVRAPRRRSVARAARSVARPAAVADDLDDVARRRGGLVVEGRGAEEGAVVAAAAAVEGLRLHGRREQARREGLRGLRGLGLPRRRRQHERGAVAVGRRLRQAPERVEHRRRPAARPQQAAAPVREALAVHLGLPQILAHGPRRVLLGRVRLGLLGPLQHEFRRGVETLQADEDRAVGLLEDVRSAAALAQA